MKIAIDLLSTIPGKSGAIGLWREILRIMPELNKKNEYLIYASPSTIKYLKKK